MPLSSNSAYASNIRLGPGIEPFIAVGPTTSYRLTATNAEGTVATATAAITVDNPFTLAFDAPVDQQLIQRPDVLVRGSFLHAMDHETGITVNGITALQYADQFMANHVPLVQGENVIAVTATDGSGRAYSIRETVIADIPEQYCTATVAPEAGLAPYEGELRISAPTTLRDTQVLAYGYGGVTYGQGPPDLHPITIEQPGLYRFEVEATASSGEVFTDEVALLVYDRGQLDDLLQAKWNAMKARLAAGDVSGAVSYYANGTKNDYEAVFTSLGTQLPQIAQQMGPIQMIIAKDGSAKYRIKRSETYQGQTYDITYPIYFTAEENGLWKIERY